MYKSSSVGEILFLAGLSKQPHISVNRAWSGIVLLFLDSSKGMQRAPNRHSTFAQKPGFIHRLKPETESTELVWKFVLGFSQYSTLESVAERSSLWLESDRAPPSKGRF